MPSIPTVDVSGYLNKPVAIISGEEIFSTLSYSNNWNYIRFGALLSIENYEFGLLNSQFAMGMCNSALPGYNGSGVKNYVGYNSVGNLTFGTGSGIYFYSGLNCGPARRTGDNDVISSLDQMNKVFAAKTGISGYQMAPVYIDVLKGSPNYSITAYTVGTGLNFHNVYSVADFISGLDAPTGGTIALTSMTLKGMALNKDTVATVACSELNGGFDTISLYWYSTAFPLYLYAWGARIKS